MKFKTIITTSRIINSQDWTTGKDDRKNDLKGTIRSELSGQIIYSELQWEYDHDGVFIKDNFTMTLQYDNVALWTGLELYGNLLTCILIIGLILTTILPAISK